MPLHLYNTLSGTVEEFRPLHGNEVRMYACGPTVYDYGHIGNFRTFIAVDLLNRFLRLNGYNVHYVMNITDVDDKIIRNAARDGVSVKQYTAPYDQAFQEDSDLLNILRPDEMPHATDYIDDMAKFVADLEKKGYAYRTDDGSYYFRIAKFAEYGKLSKRDFAGMSDGARVDVDEYEKDSARDFALWKAPKAGEASWDTVVGPGRPGWHLECSVMSMAALGETLDLHAGGEDLMFPHHENEIAQSEAQTGKPFARFWMHARFLLVEGEKMSKSQGNFFTPRDLVLKGYKPSSIRYLLTSVPYRNQLNFTFSGLQQAAASVERLRNFRQRIAEGSFPDGVNADLLKLTDVSLVRMRRALEDDLNTAQAQAAIFEMVRAVNVTVDGGEMRKGNVLPCLNTIREFDQIFGVIVDDDAAKVRRILEWAKASGRTDISPEALANAGASGPSDAEVAGKIAEMEQARKTKNFAESDRLRAELAAAGIVVEITKDGIRWKRK